MSETIETPEPTVDLELTPYIPLPLEIKTDELACPAIRLQLYNLLGEGAFGSVFQVCDQEDCDKVIKLQVLPKGSRIANFREEVKKCKRASDMGYGPRMFWACLSDGRALQSLLNIPVNSKFLEAPVVGLIVQEAWDGSLNQLSPIEWCNANVLRLLQDKVRKMHEDGIVHGDLLPKNVLYRKRDGVIVDVMPADFGNSFFWQQAQWPEWIQTLYD